ncbi:GMC oxidoreductase [Streptomyces sp. NPDC051572]|uniref:GMC oxidoreductase n=1 Tax=Streptomyces sp. NPDC051572 TaxID=3155802 RepID=UPI00344B0BC0
MSAASGPPSSAVCARTFGATPIADRIMAETLPGPSARVGQEIVGAGRDHGRRGHHAVGTCPAGLAGDDLVDVRLRVHGIAGLRIVDRSALRATLSRSLDASITGTARRPADPAPDAGRPRLDTLTDR